MNVIRREAWDRYAKANRSDDMGVMIDFADLWANLMEQTMGDGAVSAVAEATAQLANHRYPQSWGSADYAARLLCATWVHGEQLAEWFNAREGRIL